MYRNKNYIKHASFAHIHLITYSTMRTKGRGERSRSERSRAVRGIRGRAGRADRRRGETVGRGGSSRAVRGAPMISYYNYGAFAFLLLFLYNCRFCIEKMYYAAVYNLYDNSDTRSVL